MLGYKLLHQRINNWLGHSAVWGITAQNLPNKHNRLVLDPNAIDANSDPTVQLIYKVSNNSKCMVKLIPSKAVQSFGEAETPE